MKPEASSKVEIRTLAEAIAWGDSWQQAAIQYMIERNQAMRERNDLERLLDEQAKQLTQD